MSDLEDKLNTLLSDPAQMAQVMQLAQQLSGSFGSSMGAASSPPPSSPAPPPQQTTPSMLDGIDMASVMRFLPLLQELNHPNQQAAQLLNALRPFLKAEKQDKIQRAIQLARLIHVGKKALTEMGGPGHV